LCACSLIDFKLRRYLARTF